jgi:hypothetical protein
MHMRMRQESHKPWRVLLQQQRHGWTRRCFWRSDGCNTPSGATRSACNKFLYILFLSVAGFTYLEKASVRSPRAPAPDHPSGCLAAPFTFISDSIVCNCLCVPWIDVDDFWSVRCVDLVNSP